MISPWYITNLPPSLTQWQQYADDSRENWIKSLTAYHGRECGIMSTGSKMQVNLTCKSDGKVSKFYLMQNADLEPTSLTHEHTLLAVSFREDFMDYNIKLVTDKDLNTLNPFFQTQKSKSSLNKGRQWPVSLCIWGALQWLALRFSLSVENAENHNNGKNGADVKFQSTSSCGLQIPVHGVNQNVAQRLGTTCSEESTSQGCCDHPQIKPKTTNIGSLKSNKLESRGKKMGYGSKQ